jgi:hypothetical protein
MEKALNIVLSQPDYSEYESVGNEVTKVFKSIYHSNSVSRVGCKSGSNDAEFLRLNCEPLCPFSDSFSELGFKR